MLIRFLSVLPVYSHLMARPAAHSLGDVTRYPVTCTLWRTCWIAIAWVITAVLPTQSTADPGLPTTDPPARPVFEDGEAQIVPAFQDKDFWIRQDLWVETEFDSDDDGKPDRMHVSVTRPRQTETEGLKLPVVYISSPYFAGVGKSNENYFWDPRQELNSEPPPRTHQPPVQRRGMRPVISKSHEETWVPRGYIVVHSSSPGTGLSQGCPTIGGENESLAPKAVIDWLCGRGNGYTTADSFTRVSAGWCTGKVGMTGTSYNGTIPIAAATTGVDGLEAIIPIAPNTSYYHYYRSNGLVRHPFNYIGEDIDCLYEFVHSGPEPTRAYCDCHIRDQDMLKHFDRKNGDYNDFWASRDYLNHIQPFKAALLMAHAFNDWNVVPEHSVRIYEAAKAKGIPAQIYLHQGGHGGEPPMKMMNRWFTRYLHQVENGVENDERAWIVRENDPRDKPTSYPEYPHPDARPILFRLDGGAPKRGKLIASRPHPRPRDHQSGQSDQPMVESFEDNYSFDGQALARAEWTQHRLMYVTKTLNQPVHISGTPRISIRMAADRAAANLSVWLVSLPWNTGRKAKITDNIITRGWADPQNAQSLTVTEPLVPGEFRDVKFDLQPDDQVIQAGQQIGLMIFSSDQDFTLWPTPGTKLSVDLSHTTITLPIVGGRKAWKQSIRSTEKKTETQTAD